LAKKLKLENSLSTGLLSIVGTPIGNLGDASTRLVQSLTSADIILCEDSRRCSKLLTAFGIPSKPMILVNKDTELSKLDIISAHLLEGKHLVLTSDAGMPTVSDPGQLVINHIAELGLRVEIIPGPSAVSSALALSGFQSSRFIFEGFLPRKGKERTSRIDSIVSSTCVVIVFESPHRVADTLLALELAGAGNRNCMVCRELTKIHEETYRGTISELAISFKDSKNKGEFVLVFDSFEPNIEVNDDQILLELHKRISSGNSKKQAVSQITEEFQVRKNRVYELALKL